MPSILTTLGVPRANLLKKIRLEGVLPPDALRAAEGKLGRRRDHYTSNELEELVELLFSKIDAVILDHPDVHIFAQVQAASKNRLLYESAKLRLRKRNTDAVVLERTNRTNRLRVLRGNTEVGYIWWTRAKVPGKSGYTPGWTNSRSREVFSGEGGKGSVVQSLVALFDSGQDLRG